MLPIERYPKFLSPSSLSKYEKMPLTFYLTRMAPDPLLPVSDTKATSLGTAIDGEVKLHICEQYGWTEKIHERILKDIFDPLQRERASALSLERLLFENVPSADGEELALGRAIGRWYVNSPMYKSLNIVDIEYHPKFSIYNGNPAIVVPLYCKLDMVVEILGPSGLLRVPLDLKSTSGSPAQGYFMLYDASKYPSGEYGKHKLFREGINFSEINQSWDDQLLVYHWALQHYKTNRDVDISLVPPVLPAMIEQICIGSSLRVARFMANCGSSAMLYSRFDSMWTDIHSGAFTDKLIDNRTLLEHFAQKEKFW